VILMGVNMPKIPIIDNCEECNKFINGFTKKNPYKDNYCKLSKRNFGWSVNMPDWCRLQDATYKSYPIPTGTVKGDQNHGGVGCK